MAAYIARRLIWVGFLLFVVTLITFVHLHRPARGRPRGRACWAPAVSGADRVDPRAVGTRQAQAGAVRQLHRGHPAVLRPRQRDLLLGLLPEPDRRCCPRSSTEVSTTLFLTAGAVLSCGSSIGIPIGVISCRQDGLSGWIACRWASRSSSSRRRSTSSASSRSYFFDDNHRQVPDPPGQLRR